jgi:hypothetical protein
MSVVVTSESRFRRTAMRRTRARRQRGSRRSPCPRKHGVEDRRNQDHGDDKRGEGHHSSSPSASNVLTRLNAAMNALGIAVGRRERAPSVQRIWPPWSPSCSIRSAPKPASAPLLCLQMASRPPAAERLSADGAGPPTAQTAARRRRRAAGRIPCRQATESNRCGRTMGMLASRQGAEPARSTEPDQTILVRSAFSSLRRD